MRCKREAIPLIDRPAEYVGKLVHVDKWPFGCVFRLQSTDGKDHILITPKTGKVYRTSNRLQLTRAEYERLQP